MLRFIPGLLCPIKMSSGGPHNPSHCFERFYSIPVIFRLCIAFNLTYLEVCTLSLPKALPASPSEPPSYVRVPLKLTTASDTYFWLQASVLCSLVLPWDRLRQEKRLARWRRLWETPGTQFSQTEDFALVAKSICKIDIQY